MKDKIERLKQVSKDLDNILWLLEGNDKKENHQGNGTIAEELSCYRSEAIRYQEVLDDLFRNHGTEILPTED